jgi:hydrolase, HAD superfamily, cof family
MPTIKLIATDMDGTFLNSNKDYDRKRFNRIFQQLQAQDITFVVASGNQVAQLQSFFPEDIRSNIIFAGDNGGVIYPW